MEEVTIGPNIRYFTLVVDSIFILLMIGMLKQKKLDFQLIVLWIPTLLIISVLCLYPPALFQFSTLLDIKVPIHALLFFSSLFLLSIVFFLTLKISRLRQEMRTIVQQMAILKKDLEKFK